MMGNGGHSIRLRNGDRRRENIFESQVVWLVMTGKDVGANSEQTIY